MAVGATADVGPRVRLSTWLPKLFEVRGRLRHQEVKDASPGHLGSSREVRGGLDQGRLEEAQHLEDMPGLRVTVGAWVAPSCPLTGAPGG